MSYEVYIDVRHHPRHLEDSERHLSSAGRWAEPRSADPCDADRMRTVCSALRSMANDYDPDATCSNCGESRHAHHGYPDSPVRCFGQYGPIAQYAWWNEPSPDPRGGAR